MPSYDQAFGRSNNSQLVIGSQPKGTVRGAVAGGNDAVRDGNVRRFPRYCRSSEGRRI